MKRAMVRASWVLALAALCAGCSDQATESSGPVTRYVPFYVTEAVCVANGGGYQLSSGVRAECEFEPQDGRESFTVQYESPGPGRVWLQSGEYRVTVRACRAGQDAEMPGALVFHGHVGSSVDPVPDTTTVPRMTFANDTLRFVTELVTYCPDSLGITLMYNDSNQLTPEEERSVISSINGAGGGYLVADGAELNLRDTSLNDLTLADYSVPINQSMFLYEVVDSCKAYVKANPDAYPCQIIVYVRSRPICYGG